MPTRTAQGRICEGLGTPDTAFRLLVVFLKVIFRGRHVYARVCVSVCVDAGEEMEVEMPRQAGVTPQHGHLRTMERGRMKRRENEETKALPWCN